MNRTSPRPAHPGPPTPRAPAGRAVAARRAAASALRQVIESKSALDEALARATSRGPGLEPRDAQLARAILTVSLKRLGGLRAALDERLEKNLSGLPPDLAATLTIAAAQILFMAVPPHAAVDSAVEVIRTDRKLSGLAGLTNAVLRRIAAEREQILAAWALVDDLPVWLAMRWRAAYGEDRFARIAAIIGQEPTLDVTTLSQPEHWAEKLGGIVTPTGSIRLVTHDAIDSLPGYGDGQWFVQDAAAALPARLLAAQAGERVLDLCAAPGGKTAQLAATGASVVAIDRSQPRLGRLRENLRRLKLSAEIVAADATTWDGAAADAILLDAPCASTGTIRRHPDVAWTKSEDDIASLSDLQRRLLDHAVDLLKPGGRLVYSTCSLEPEEGERQIEALLARRDDVSIDTVREGEISGLGRAIDAQGALRTTPEMWPHADARFAGLDGFYAARLRRSG